MKSALLTIEFQKEWLPEGKLGKRIQDKQQFANSLSNAEQVITHARAIKLPIFHSGLSFSDDYRELGNANTGLRKRIQLAETFKKHECGSDFLPEFIPLENEWLTQGRTGSSAFAGSNLDSLLRNNGITRLFIMGYALNICVESTLRAAHDLGYETYVILDACSAFTAAQKQFFEDNIINHFGMGITTKQFMMEINDAK